MKACDLLSQSTAADLLKVGELDPPDTSKGFLGEFTMSRHCTWKYERVDDWESGVPARPQVRTLSIILMVYPADYRDYGDGGTPYAAQELPKQSHKGRESVPDIGEQAFWWPGESTHQSRSLAFQRANAVVTVHFGGYDCCQDNGIGIDIPDAELRDVVTQAAREIDDKLKSIK